MLLLLVISVSAGYSFTAYGYYTVNMIKCESIEVSMKEDVTIAVRFLPNLDPFLEATIIASTHPVSATYILDPNANVVLSGTNVSLTVFGDVFPPYLEIWVIPIGLCPSTAFDMPNATGISLALHAENVFSPVCVFLSRSYAQESSNLCYGFTADDGQARFEVYSNGGMAIKEPESVCAGAFCRIKIDFPAVVRFRVLRRIEPSSASMFLEMEENAVYHPRPHYTTTALPFYNISGKFVVGEEFTKHAIDVVAHVDDWERAAGIIAIVVSVLMVCLIVVAAVTQKLVGEGEMDTSTMSSLQGYDFPSSIVLNPFCPDSSATLKIIK